MDTNKFNCKIQNIHKSWQLVQISNTNYLYIDIRIEYNLSNNPTIDR